MIKIGSFFEEHVEKIVLGIVGAVCVWLLITRVILSPNTASYDSQNFSPSAIDNYVYGKAQDLRQKLNEPPEKLEPYKPKVGEFLALLDSAISDIDISLWPAVPDESKAEEPRVAGVYRLPVIGEVNDVAAENIRAVAYVPIAEVTPQTPYDKAGNEPNDIDLVTVEGKFDVAGLYDRLNATYVEDVEEQYADPCFAKPIFAASQLQRQELSGDGIWSDWQDVPRTRIDQHGKLFEIIEDTKDLPPGGLKVQMLRFDYKDVQIDLLQPQAYQIASAKEEWLPPSLHPEFLEFQRKAALEEKRQAKETKRKELDRGREERRSRRTDTGFGVGGRSSGRGGLNQFGGAEGSYGPGGSRSRNRSDRSRDPSDRSGGITGGYQSEGGRSTNRRRSSGRRTTTDPMQDAYAYDGGMDGPGAGTRRGTQRRPSIYDVYDKYDELQLTRLTDLEKMREPLTFWRHDDTVEPLKTYRYRIRLGVFNPVAGREKNDVILWSDFSDTTEPVEILGRLYFFANHMREAGKTKTVTVQVSRLTLGHWYTQDFPVKQGEVIGEVVDYEPEEPERRPGSLALGARGGRGGLDGRFTPFARAERDPSVPETIDYGTGAVLVDAVVVNDWSGASSLRTRHYYDMLYSLDGFNIRHMPVGQTYWAADLQRAFSHILRLQKQPREAFQAFGSGGRKQRPGGREYEMEDYYDDAMYDEGMEGMEGMRGGRY